MAFSNTGTKKRIAVIGGGASGIASIVQLKNEGMEPVCFEAKDKYGGKWNYREDSEEGYASIMPTTFYNNSKEIVAVSNFPPKKEYNNYMRHREVFQYITDYYKHHGVDKYISFNCEVIKVEKAKDYVVTGRYSVTVKNKITGNISMDIFDGVMVCTGPFTWPKIHDFTGIDKFKGTVIHTHSLKTVDKFKNQRVLVIGSGGGSGLNAAEVITSVAKQVYLSTPTGIIALNRVGTSGYPIDYIIFRRYLVKLLDILPTDWCSFIIEKFYLDKKFDSNLYFIKPNYGIFSKEPAVNDAITSKLLSGSVIQKEAVKYFTENGVVFNGEESVTELDAVIMATGYTWKYPFLEDGLLTTENGRINLYKCMYPTQLPHSTLAFIGFIKPFGPDFPIEELQIRYASKVFNGNVVLPPNDVMLRDVIKRHKINEKRYVTSDYNSVQIDLVSYCDDIASKIGVKPNLLKYFFTDFPLFLKLVFGPSVPYQYRLKGPDKWEGAREAIMTTNERLLWPLTRENKSSKGVGQLILEFLFGLFPVTRV